jgi:cation diffusion facilitator CzcD-associated flavoprotein CzcO
MTPTSQSSLETRSADWLSSFEDALSRQHKDHLHDLFTDDCHWRDVVAFTWDVHQCHGVENVSEELLLRSAAVQPRSLAIDPGRPAPRAGTLGEHGVLEVFFTFETEAGQGRGLICLKSCPESSGGLRGFLLFTRLESLNGVQTKYDGERHPGLGFEPARPGQTWAEHRADRIDYKDREPEVLVVGGGQAGVCIAALLDNLGVDVLVVDKNERAGDSWRKRYESLALHTPTDMSDFPFIAFPKTFPKYLPKNKFADWIECYVTLMDLNYWTSTEFATAEFDEDTQRWTAQVRCPDGSLRTLRPAHVVVTVGGAGGSPNRPDLLGLEDFSGTVLHSSAFRSAADFEDTRALVVGVGTSAHDISLDLYHHGATVTMLQRGPTSVVDVESANVVFADYFTDMPQDEADQRSSAKYIYPLQLELLKRYTEWTSEANAELLADLERAGMRLDVGEDGTGWPMKFARYAGGYYLNVGASDVIVSGGIKIRAADTVDHFESAGLRLKDGSLLDLDVVLLATGYENLTADVRRFFGAKVAEKVGPVGGLGIDGERLNFCKPTAQQQLWFIFGGIIEGRRSASWLALMIKAQLAGLVQPVVRGQDGRLTTP